MKRSLKRFVWVLVVLAALRSEVVKTAFAETMSDSQTGLPSLQDLDLHALPEHTAFQLTQDVIAQQGTIGYLTNDSARIGHGPGEFPYETEYVYEFLFPAYAHRTTMCALAWNTKDINDRMGWLQAETTTIIPKGEYQLNDSTTRIHERAEYELSGPQRIFAIISIIELVKKDDNGTKLYVLCETPAWASGLEEERTPVTVKTALRLMPYLNLAP